ncbi:MAG: DUF5060 domain-containing protein [Planctomycetota bacterium]
MSRPSRRKVCARVAYFLLALSTAFGRHAAAQGTVGGELTKWHTVEVDFQADAVFAELDGRDQVGGPTATANPFLDRELEVTFSHAASGTNYTVPGFFDGNGAGNGTGDTFRVRFVPDQPGDWTYSAAFNSGVNVAIGDTVGTPVNGGSFISGTATGAFTVADLDLGAPGFKSQGRLEYVGGHYLKYRDGGYFIKSGADSPENLLAFRGFDNTQTKGGPNSLPGREGILHDYAPHSGDYQPGDPAWDTPDFDYGNTLAQGGDGRNILGAANYLQSVGVNSIYFMVNNVGGDGKDAHPFAAVSTTSQLAGETNSGTPNDNLHYDISKLAQWETFFDHAQERGLHLNVVLNEAEFANKQELDDGTLGVERKLFYREMIARFGHHNSLNWNLSEEFDLGNGFGGNIQEEADRIVDFAEFLSGVDPYGRPLTVHNAANNNFTSNPLNSPYQYFIDEPDFDLTSLQRAGQKEGWSDTVEAFRTATASVGRPLAVMVDEPESITRISLGPNDDTEPGTTDAERFNTVRKTMAWDILLSGGGVEWFINDADQDVEDFREYEQVWLETGYAREFLEDSFPFWEMTPDDDLVRGEDTDYGGAEVFAKPGEAYAVYLPDGSNDDNPQTIGEIEAGQNGPPELDLTAFPGDEFVLRWFNPRTGQYAPGETLLTGGDWVSLGVTPDGFSSLNDWAAAILAAPSGDFDGDGDVDLSDLMRWQRGGSPNGPGAADLADWQSAFTGSASSAAVAVPEPAAAGLLIAAALAALTGRLLRRKTTHQ